MTEIATSAVFEANLQDKAPCVVLWGQKSDVNSSTASLQLSSYAPGIIALSKDPTPVFLRVDIDLNPDLAMKYSIRAVPTIMLFVSGAVVVSETTMASFLAGIKLWII